MYFLALFFSAAGVLTGGMVVRNVSKPAGEDTGGAKDFLTAKTPRAPKGRKRGSGDISVRQEDRK
jgi:predicted small integral membrane protein